MDVSQITIIFTKVNYSQSAFLAHTLQCLHVDSGYHNGKLSQLWCSLSLFTFCSYWILVESFSGCSIAPNRKTIGMSVSSITIMSIFFQGYFLPFWSLLPLQPTSAILMFLPPKDISQPLLLPQVSARISSIPLLWVVISLPYPISSLPSTLVDRLLLLSSLLSRVNPRHLSLKAIANNNDIAQWLLQAVMAAFVPWLYSWGKLYSWHYYYISQVQPPWTWLSVMCVVDDIMQGNLVEIDMQGI